MDAVRSILVATDLTEASDHVMQAAGALAALTGAELHVLHAFELDAVPYVTASDQPPTFQGRIAEAEQALDAQLARTVRGKVNVASREIILYAAFKAVRDWARYVDADVIVLGRHRRRGVADAVLGGTADRVIRTVDVPCLIVHGPLSLPLRRIVVPVDLSAPAIVALDVALTWSSALGPAGSAPELIVLHVIPRVFDAADVPLDHAVIGPELRSQIEEARLRVDVDAATAVREEVRWADSPVAEILNFVQEEKPDLTVLGTHGHGAIKRALIGSVASGVARAAPCPVLLVPPAAGSLD